MNVTVIGSFMYDLMADAPRPPRLGETLRGTAFRRSVGGKGFNQAVAAARTGAQVAMIGRIGDDPFGQEFRTALHSEGIAADHVLDSTVDGSGTGIGMPVVFPDGNNSIIIIPRANLEVTDEDVDSALPLVGDSDVVLLQLEIPIPVVEHAARRAHEQGAHVVVNPAPFHALPASIWEHVDLFVPNEGELAAYCSDAGIVADTPAEQAEQFAARFDVEVIVTLGAAGALLRPAPGSSRTPVDIPGIRVRAVDAVGAGDAYCGALCARIAAGDPISDAMRYANAAAALSVTKHGSGTAAPTDREIRDLLNEEEPQR